MLRFISVCVAALVGVHLQAAPVLPAPAQYPSFSVATGVLLLPDVLIVAQGMAWGHVRADLAAFAFCQVPSDVARARGRGIRRALGVYPRASSNSSMP